MAIVKKHRVQPKLIGNKHVRERRMPKPEVNEEKVKFISKPIRKNTVTITKKENIIENSEPIAVETKTVIEEPVIEETVPKKKRQTKKKAEETENNTENTEEYVQ